MHKGRNVNARSSIMGYIGELISNAMHSTPQGFLGVSLIGIYFCVIVGTALYRIKNSGHH